MLRLSLHGVEATMELRKHGVKLINAVSLGLRIVHLLIIRSGELSPDIQQSINRFTEGGPISSSEINEVADTAVRHCMKQGESKLV